MVKLLRMKVYKLLLLVLLFGAMEVQAQQDSTVVEADSTVYVLSDPAPEKFQWFEFRGYLKFMQTIGFAPSSDIGVDNLLHNRLNFRFNIPKGGRFNVQLRNRIFYGTSVKTIPGYGEFVTQYDGVIPLEWLAIDNQNFLVNFIVDRLNYTYSNNKLEFTIGRQRINWGINTTWNPNDIFNSYNIYDFDYEEREGSDAVRLTIFPTIMSSIDMAYKFTGDFDTDVFAVKYLFNKWAYDFQFFAGKFQENITFGAGWAGSIKAVGFKGEATYFLPYNASGWGNVSASGTLDYSWANGIYLMGTYLFNSTGSNHPIDPTVSVIEVPSAEYLMPAKHNAMLTVSYPFSPVFAGNMGVIYSFEINALTLFPTLTFNLKSNLDLDLIGQVFFQEIPNDKFRNIGNGVFGRLKWSF